MTDYEKNLSFKIHVVDGGDFYCSYAVVANESAFRIRMVLLMAILLPGVLTASLSRWREDMSMRFLLSTSKVS